MITINNLEKMQPYYNKATNTYTFNDDVRFDTHISVDRNITAWDIDAKNITAKNITSCNIHARDINAKNITASDIDAKNITALDINANDITADNITAWDISYYAICVSYNNIVCNSIKGRRKNSKHFALDGKIIIKGE